MDKEDDFVPIHEKTVNFEPMTDKMTFDLETDRYIQV